MPAGLRECPPALRGGKRPLALPPEGHRAWEGSSDDHPDATAPGGRQRLMQQLQQTEEQAPSEGWSSVGSSRQGPDSGTQRLSVHEGAPNPGLPQSPPPPSAQSTSARLLQAGRGYRAASGQRKDEGPGHNHPSLRALRPQQGPEPAGTSGLQGRVAQGGPWGSAVQWAPCRGPPDAHSPPPQSRSNSCRPAFPTPGRAGQGP